MKITRSDGFARTRLIATPSGRLQLRNLDASLPVATLKRCFAAVLILLSVKMLIGIFGQ